ncbi:phosphate ABC transporter substrate-binding protein [Pedobacter sp. HMF7647]|uniref:Phosphate ABC transporter substrate-binding protein n=1 Tax=Hufsiella arboris TaxID=2695275 RepID=A0A7K1YAL5_9SPHI|nr:substrate-binding domain-containing protein [Hufsiella arboris]MXV51627.1 phosphate ABC transporter substrate-binding protein [Hufsiella arboris]
MIKIYKYTFLILGISVFTSCKQSSKPTQTTREGSATFVADETFKPIIDDELYIFHNTYPNAQIKVRYEPERTVLNEFLNNDTTRVAILARELTQKERKVFLDKKIVIRTNRFVIDGIALIANTASLDTGVTVQEIINLMQSKPSNIKKLVFDNANSSTVRYLKELSNVKKLPTTGIYALQSNPEVIKFVSENTGALGVVGVNWLIDPKNDLKPAVDKIKILGVKNLQGKKGADKFYEPDQNNLALGLYPLTRNVYIIDCQGGTGLGTGFASFIAGETGQRIVLKSGLLPDSIPPRELIIRKTLEK